MSTWEERMSAKAKARQAARDAAQEAEPAAGPNHEGVPGSLAADLPEGADDVPRWWCTSCGLPDAPTRTHWSQEDRPCPRCGSRWRWYGRVADRDGTATQPPADECRDCHEWRQHEHAHFGWVWVVTCFSGDTGECRYGHRHHDGEIWLA